MAAVGAWSRRTLAIFCAVASSACIPSFESRECYSDEDCIRDRVCRAFACVRDDAQDGGADSDVVIIDGSSPDGGIADGGTRDASSRDAGIPDLGLRDPCDTAMAAWIDHSPAISPFGRDRAVLAYSPIGRVLVLQGGVGRSATLGDDTWSWNGSRWIQESPFVSDIGPRYDHAAAQDRFGNVVVFGGRRVQDLSTPSFLSDTWTWDAVSWIERTSSSTTPPARGFARMAYDSLRGISVLFGGMARDESSLADTWEWDGDEWTNRTPPSPSDSPSGRNTQAMGYDPVRRAVVLFGGASAPNQPARDVWAWDGTAWTELATTNTPIGRSGAQMAFDERRRVLVMFGGSRGAGDIVNETWELAEDDHWTQIATPAEVSVATNAVLAYDRAADRMITIGGWNGGGHPDRTWLYCGPP